MEIAAEEEGAADPVAAVAGGAVEPAVVAGAAEIVAMGAVVWHLYRCSKAQNRAWAPAQKELVKGWGLVAPSAGAGHPP